MTDRFGVSTSDDDNLQLREATSDDARFVWKTNNDPSVRARSVDTDPIPWEDHCEWFEATLSSDARLLWIPAYHGEECGVVRMDVNFEASEAEISIAIRPDFRGRGIGTSVIQRASEQTTERDDIERVLAHVRPDNEASIRAFEKAGFEAIRYVERDGIELVRFEFS